MLVAGDIYRPAAIDQLQTVGKQLDVPVHTVKVIKLNHNKLLKMLLKHAKEEHLDLSLSIQLVVCISMKH